MDELIAGPELDRRVCEILGIEPDGGETFDPSDPVYPCVSTDPATIPVVMEAIRKKFNRCGIEIDPEYKPEWFANRNGDGADHCEEFNAATPNLALCGLAVKLGGWEVSDTIDNEIARGESPESYENSGWIATVDGDKAAILKFAHCSCYGTAESAGEEWTGTVAQLIEMANRRADPTMPERVANTRDHDYADLGEMYLGVLAWANQQKGASRE